jgi:hypothetical protein
MFTYSIEPVSVVSRRRGPEPLRARPYAGRTPASAPAPGQASCCRKQREHLRAYVKSPRANHERAPRRAALWGPIPARSSDTGSDSHGPADAAAAAAAGRRGTLLQGGRHLHNFQASGPAPCRSARVQKDAGPSRVLGVGASEP